MNPQLLAVIGLRAAALAASLAGRSSTASALYSLADLIDSGVAVDAHMAEIAAKLKDRRLVSPMPTGRIVANRIHADSARLQTSCSCLPTSSLPPSRVVSRPHARHVQNSTCA
jgi:hypothetical protein